MTKKPKPHKPATTDPNKSAKRMLDSLIEKTERTGKAKAKRKGQP